nr:helicase-related protein [Shewanella vesiculosa]
MSRLIKANFDENAVVVTYRENDPSTIIQQFRQEKTKWIISVGMISEGTNIPRLQVCCHLTNIKTEMHFRQILGRILRMTISKNKEAILYMPAEPKLLEYAYRVKQDVPFEADVVKFEKMKKSDEKNANNTTIAEISFDREKKVRPRLELKSFGVKRYPLLYRPSELSERFEPVVERSRSAAEKIKAHLSSHHKYLLDPPNRH